MIEKADFRISGANKQKIERHSKGVFAINERGYKLTSKNIRWWLLLILYDVLKTVMEHQKRQEQKHLAAK